MARENTIENARSIESTFGELLGRDGGERTDFDGARGTPVDTDVDIEIDCPNCDHRFTFDGRARPARGGLAEPSCPACDESFSVRVGSEFALVERDGWAVSVSVGREESRR